MTYDGMRVANGLAWESLIRGDLDQIERDKIKKALLDYCGQDQLAMVKLIDNLRFALTYRERTVSTQAINFASNPRLTLSNPRCSSSRCSIGSNVLRRIANLLSAWFPSWLDTGNLPALRGFWRYGQSKLAVPKGR